VNSTEARHQMIESFKNKPNNAIFCDVCDSKFGPEVMVVLFRSYRGQAPRFICPACIRYAARLVEGGE